MLGAEGVLLRAVCVLYQQVLAGRRRRSCGRGCEDLARDGCEQGVDLRQSRGYPPAGLLWFELRANAPYQLGPLALGERRVVRSSEVGEAVRVETFCPLAFCVGRERDREARVGP